MPQELNREAIADTGLRGKQKQSNLRKFGDARGRNVRLKECRIAARLGFHP